MSTVDILFIVLEITYLAGIAAWPLLVILSWLAFCSSCEERIAEVGITALVMYTLFGCLSWLGQLVDITRYLVWPIVLRHKWWWVLRIIGHSPPWSIGPWEIRATIVGAILLVTCGGFIYWLARDDRPLYG